MDILKKHLLFIIVITLVLLSCSTTKKMEFKEETKTENIILMIGDGMGLAQVSTAYYFGKGTPNFSRFKYIGLHKNQPAYKKITDSAAGATAFSTGYKSYNGAIGVDKDTIPRETILELAAKQQKSIGLITTSSITHATPASFYAHVSTRNAQEEIAADFITAPIDFAAAGGYQFFNQRKDKKDLLAELRSKGTIVNTNELETNLQFGNRYACFLEADSLHSMRGGRGDFLAKSTTTALNFLSKNKDGFFLMIESAQIDWGGHNNDGKYIIDEVLDFDKVIGLALDFAQKEGNTLVIVTADHETGGLSLSPAEVFGQRKYDTIHPTFSTGGHSASLIPVFAFGPGAENFSGVYENTAIFSKMLTTFIGLE